MAIDLKKRRSNYASLHLTRPGHRGRRVGARRIGVKDARVIERGALGHFVVAVLSVRVQVEDEALP